MLSKNHFPLFLFFALVLLFFYPFLLHGKIPIPADTIVGMYHPWRDTVWNELTAGVPYKNPLITDPVRQQYVWRELAIDQLKKWKLPLWNPYSFSGTPLLSNFQTAAFYPPNIAFFIFSFPVAWGILVFMQPLLAGIFLYAYLRYVNLSKTGSLLAGITWAFSGFSVAWLEWNTVVHTALWLPLILLSVEKILKRNRHSERPEGSRGIFHNPSLLNKIPPRAFGLVGMTMWSIVFLFSLCSSFFAGHLQTFFYSFCFVILYLLARLIGSSFKIIAFSSFWQGVSRVQNRNDSLRDSGQASMTIFSHFAFCILIFSLITAIQWYPTLQFANLSARFVDLGSWEKEGWFLPWQHLMQFIAPDFFGNPATNNYWGIWNYGEFIGYIGIVPLFFALYAAFFRRDKKTVFFSGLALAGLIFALPNFLSKLPFILRIPFVSTSQPTRLLYIVDFCLSILVALGFDQWMKDKQYKKTLIVFCVPVVFLFIGFAWSVNPDFGILESTVIFQQIAKRNLILPAVFVSSSLLLLSLYQIMKKPTLNLRLILFIAVFAITILDLFRFGWKFTPFSPKEWIYPETALLRLRNEEKKPYRIMATDRRITPSNFSVHYRLQDVSGYDPLYLLRYNQYVSAWTRNTPDIAPSAFNRLLTPNDPDSFFADLIGVKYVISFGEHPSSKLKYIASEGETYLYENPFAFSRAFFASRVQKSSGDEDEMKQMFALGPSLRHVAVTSEIIPAVSEDPISEGETIEIISYQEDQIQLQTISNSSRLLVLTDPYYPSWRVSIDGGKSKIYRVDFLFRGIVVPAGKHEVVLRNTILHL